MAKSKRPSEAASDMPMDTPQVQPGESSRGPRPNTLNDLTNSEWIVETKSVWFSKPPRRDKRKLQHPATFAETDIARLIRFFTKQGETVLDPFLGTGSTLVACAQTGRFGTGIELSERWADTARARLAEVDGGDAQTVITGDARTALRGLEEDSVSFIVTSPPYWSILGKKADHKTLAERRSKGLETQYSNDTQDLGNTASYEGFLSELGIVFSQCCRLLRPRGYMAVIVSDFRHGSKFVPYHTDISRAVESVGMTLEGITVLVQDSKALYPYGMPHAFVSNVHHQYILIFRKLA
jgi:DNA modification methylase